MKKNITDNKNGGLGRQEEYYKTPLKNDTFHINEIGIKDIDSAVVKTLQKHLDIKTLLDEEGITMKKKIEVVSLISIQRFAEYMRIWQNSDNYSNIQMPFLALTRDVNIKKGTHLNNNFNIPSDITFPVYKRQVVKNGKIGYEYYNVPQPTSIDIDYTIDIVCEYMSELNAFHNVILNTFKSRQFYVNVNGHFMGMKMNAINDVSNISDLDKRKFYHIKVETTLHGYLINSEDMKKINGIQAFKVDIVPTTSKENKCEVRTIDLDCDFCFVVEFNRKNGHSTTVRVPYDIEFTYDNQSNGGYAYFLNNSIVSLPFLANKGDELIITHSKDKRKSYKVKLCGMKV